MVESHTAVIEFLKKLKLTSRACFMEILEFITPEMYDQSMPVLNTTLNCLSPIGGQFFTHFIYDGEPKGI